MIVSLFDYGAGNVHSLVKALEHPGVTVSIDDDPLRALDADALVLPGVGGFSQAADRLAGTQPILRERILAGLPTLGICLGMQLFFDRSDEGDGAGIGLIPGRVTRLNALRVPAIGWNRVEAVTDRGSAMFGSELSDVWFAHSFACRPDEVSRLDVAAWTTHESDRFPSIVRVANAIGVQFHPEKSSMAGVRWLQGWLANVATSLRETVRR